MATGMSMTARAGESRAPAVNVSEVERMASAVGGAALAVYGLTRGTLGGLALAAVGGSLVYRGISGHCALFESLGINTAAMPHGAAASVPASHGVKIEEAITINRPAAELYQFWHRLENLPRVMRHLESVRETGDRRSHWVAKGPAGFSVEWDAETINDRPNELIAWRSLANADVQNAGSVHFEDRGGGRTEVRVTLKYNPVGGKAGAAVARLFGRAPEQEVRADLQRFKELMETGATAAAAGPATRSS